MFDMTLSWGHTNPGSSDLTHDTIFKVSLKLRNEQSNKNENQVIIMNFNEQSLISMSNQLNK